jgi:hypothetical protein
MGWSATPETSSSRRSSADDDAPAPAPAKPKNTFTFRAELDLAELDERGRPGATWNGKALEISRAHLVFRSRRMCYEGRELLVAVHLIDDRPTPLSGTVTKSEYDGDGLYRTHLNLQRLPDTDAVSLWTANLLPRGRE